MQKSKLGISVGLLGAIIYFSALFSGSYLLPVILCGYVLLAEDNPWLRRSSIKAVLIMIAFSLLSFAVSIIPTFVELLQSFIYLFGGNSNMTFISNIQNILTIVISIVRSFLLVIMGLKALNQGTIRLSAIDKTIDKHTEEVN